MNSSPNPKPAEPAEEIIPPAPFVLGASYLWDWLPSVETTLPTPSDFQGSPS